MITHALVRLSTDSGDMGHALDAVIIAGSEQDCELAAYYEPLRDGYMTLVVDIEQTERPWT